MNAWVLLFVAIVLEVCGTTSMKLSEGLTRPIPSVSLFVFYAASLAVLTLALKQLELGMAYAIWSGLGTVLIAIISFAFLKEPMPLVKILSIGLVVAGVVGLKLSSGGE